MRFRVCLTKLRTLLDLDGIIPECNSGSSIKALLFIDGFDFFDTTVFFIDFEDFLFAFASDFIEKTGVKVLRFGEISSDFRDGELIGNSFISVTLPNATVCLFENEKCPYASVGLAIIIYLL